MHHKIRKEAHDHANKGGTGDEADHMRGAREVIIEQLDEGERQRRRKPFETITNEGESGLRVPRVGSNM